MSAVKWLSPMRATTLDKVCSLNRDNYSTEDFWIIADDDQVTIAQQRTGESPKAIIDIPKADFNRLIRWYMREQKLRNRSQQ